MLLFFCTNLKGQERVKKTTHIVNIIGYTCALVTMSSTTLANRKGAPVSLDQSDSAALCQVQPKYKRPLLAVFQSFLTQDTLEPSVRV